MNNVSENPTFDVPPFFACVTIVGIGMMGGSLALALRERNLARRIVGIDSNAETLVLAEMGGVIDVGTTSLAEGVREADCVVLATPVGSLPELLETLAPHLRPDALVTDLGSVKARIVATGERLFGPRFVGGHPMAGSEKSGVAAAHGNLFNGAAWAIVRTAPFDLQADGYAQRLATLIKALGANPVALDAARHDILVALVSHLPHLLSFAFARTVAANPDAEQARQMAGGSYRDIMRVSGADPALWNDIFAENRPALLAILDEWQQQLQILKDTL